MTKHNDAAYIEPQFTLTDDEVYRRVGAVLQDTAEGVLNVLLESGIYREDFSSVGQVF
jgi:hypothetical protein